MKMSLTAPLDEMFNLLETIVLKNNPVNYITSEYML